MNWACALIIETDTEYLLRAAYIKAVNRYEALGKAQAVAYKLWPELRRVHVQVCAADERHLIDDPERAEKTG